jgi:transcriptional regulator with XRE-family HTH domain
MSPLRAIRETRGLRLVDVAALARVSVELVRRVDRGATNVSLSGLVLVARALGVSPCDLYSNLCAHRRAGTNRR